MTGKKQRPITEPMYSGGNLLDFPVSAGYDEIDYTDFISSYIFNSQGIVISQSMHDGYLSACFATTSIYRPRPLVTWWIPRDYDTFISFVKGCGRNQQEYILLPVMKGLDLEYFL